MKVKIFSTGLMILHAYGVKCRAMHFESC